MSIKKILIEWLLANIGEDIAYHSLERAKNYGKHIYNKAHNQGSYDRAFRTLQNSPAKLAENGIKLVQFKKKDSTCDWWRVERA